MGMRIEVEVVPLATVSRENIQVLSEARRHLVLVVDDERLIADTLSLILSKSGFSTLTAYDASSALELVKTTPPDILISDVIMPGMTGIELAVAFTQLLPECPILLFSGNASMVDLLEEVRNDGHDFTILTKPVHPTEILRRISECLTMREACCEAAAKSLVGVYAN